MKVVKVEDFYKELKKYPVEMGMIQKGGGLLKLYKRFKLKLKKRAGDKNEYL